MAGPNGGTPSACAVQIARIDRHDERLDEHEAKIGGTFREASAAREAAEVASENSSKAYMAAERAANAVNGLAGELRDERERRQRECDIRHGTIDRRLERVEDHEDDSLTQGSGLIHAAQHPELMAARYDAKAKELDSARSELARATETMKAEMEARRTADAATAKARNQRRLAVIGAVVATISSAGTVAAAWLAGG